VGCRTAVLQKSGPQFVQNAEDQNQYNAWLCWVGCSSGEKSLHLAVQGGTQYIIHRKTKAAVPGGERHIKSKNYRTLRMGKRVFSVGQTSAEYDNDN
jgi:hypothetical protein